MLCPLSFIMNNIQGHLQKLTHKYCFKGPELYRNRTKNTFWSRFWKHKKVLETPVPAVRVDTDSSWDVSQFCYAFMLFNRRMLSLHILLRSESCSVFDRSGYILLRHLKEEVLLFYTVWWSKTSANSLNWFK